MSDAPPDIIAAAQASERKWRIPASISIAQWALESGWGKHMPPGSNNPFGMKSKPGQDYVLIPTKEVIKGQWVTVRAAFRKFASIADAFDAHGKLLATAPAYARCRNVLPDPFAFAHALTGVYATDPGYGKLLGSIITKNDLTRFDGVLA